MNQENNQRSDTLEAEKPATSATPAQQPQDQLVRTQAETQSEAPRVQASDDAGHSQKPAAQPVAQQPNKAAPQDAQQKR